jgi:hypothetical protein
MKPSLILFLSLISIFALAGDEPKLKVMILGSYHMSNPGLDVHNMKAEDVTTPERQKELAEIAAGLSRFLPNKIALERVAANPCLIDENFESQRFYFFIREQKMESLTRLQNALLSPKRIIDKLLFQGYNQAFGGRLHDLHVRLAPIS